MLKYIYLLLLLVITSSCGNTQYTFHFHQGRSLDFSKGKWVLNEPITNYNKERIYTIAHREFKKILGDSLYELRNLRGNRLMAAQMDFEPSREELRDLRRATGGDFLINVRTNISKSETSSFVHPPAMGTFLKTNQAGTKIMIYDLRSLSLLSETAVTGQMKISGSSDDSTQFVNNAETISMQSLVKLIKMYKKNRLDE